MSWLKAFMRLRNSKEIPEVTDFLVNNKTFRKIAINSNQGGKTLLGRIDDYLQKELLREDIPKERWINKDKK